MQTTPAALRATFFFLKSDKWSAIIEEYIFGTLKYGTHRIHIASIPIVEYETSVYFEAHYQMKKRRICTIEGLSKFLHKYFFKKKILF